MTSFVSNIREYLEFTIQARKRFGQSFPGPYICTDDFILQHGREWKPGKLPKRWKMAPLGQCYWNAFKLAKRHPELTYCEGYASSILPLAHAWCVNASGEVIDNTWEPTGAQYWGVAFNFDFVKKMMWPRCKYWSLLDRPDLGFPLQTGKYDPQQFLKHL